MARILLFGQAKFGAEVFRGLVEAGHEPWAVSTPPRRDPERADPLEQAALDAGVRVVQRKSYKSREAFDELGPAGADLAVLAYVTQIIPLPILDAPKHAAICFHPSLLPAYRGGSAIPWQLILGETRGGVTLFRPDQGIDTGPIYLRREIAIGPNESAASFYYDHVFEAGVEATLEAAEMALAGAEPQVQDEALASYQPLLKDEHAGIDWQAPARKIHDLVRGCDPAPGAHTRLDGGPSDSIVRLFGSALSSEGGAGSPASRGPAGGPEAGTIVAVGEQGIDVVAGDGGVVRFAKMAVQAPSARRKGEAAEIAAEISAAAGSRFL